MAGSWIQIAAPGGDSFEGYLSVPAAGSGPGLVMVQEIFGVNPSIRHLADLFAAEGFTVLAPDFFWRIEPRVEIALGRKQEVDRVSVLVDGPVQVAPLAADLDVCLVDPD